MMEEEMTTMEWMRGALRDSKALVTMKDEEIAVLKSDALDLQEQVQEARAETVSVQETLKSAKRAFQLELCEEREREERSYTYTRELEKKILTLIDEIRECQDAIREKEITIQELTHFESVAESKDAEIKDLKAALCSSKDNEVFLTGQNISLIEEVARLEAQRDKQNGKIENLKEAVRALQHQIVEAESFIWTKDELLTKQTSEIAGLKELTEELFLLTSDLKQSNSDLKTQLDTRQEEEILAGVSFREECRSLTENFDQLDVAEEQAAPAAEAPTVEAPTVEAPNVEAPTVEASNVEAPTVEAPTVEAPNVEAPAVEAPEVEAPPVEGQSSSWWRRCARRVQKVGLRVGIVAVCVLVSLSILASCSICSSGTDFSPLTPYYDIEHVTPPPF
ncbi:hypothetical protein ABVT39_012894 [Epinephelus coioides]